MKAGRHKNAQRHLDIIMLAQTKMNSFNLQSGGDRDSQPGHLAREHLAQHDAKGVHVSRRGVDAVLEDLRGHPLRRANWGAGTAAATNPRHARQPEVANLDRVTRPTCPQASLFKQAQRNGTDSRSWLAVDRSAFQKEQQMQVARISQGPITMQSRRLQSRLEDLRSRWSSGGVKPWR